MRVHWDPTEWEGKATHKYPWGQMHDVGDYFDVPATHPAQQRGVVQAASQQYKNTGYKFAVLTIPNKAKRVILLYIED